MRCVLTLRNVLRTTTACTFSTSQLPKVVGHMAYGHMAYGHMAYGIWHMAYGHMAYGIWHMAGIWQEYYGIWHVA